MVLQSVFAAVDGGNDDTDHLALRPRQGRFAIHQRFVKMHVIDQRSRMQAVDLHNVIDLTAPDVARSLISPLQLAGRGSFGHSINPCYAFWRRIHCS